MGASIQNRRTVPKELIVQIKTIRDKSYPSADPQILQPPPQSIRLPGECVKDFTLHDDPDTNALATSLVHAPETPVVICVIAEHLTAHAVTEVCHSHIQNQIVASHRVSLGILELVDERMQRATILEC